MCGSRTLQSVMEVLHIRNQSSRIMEVRIDKCGWRLDTRQMIIHGSLDLNILFCEKALQPRLIFLWGHECTKNNERTVPESSNGRKCGIFKND